jgi:regulator of protease activity HflC (stomatin/prohibitin superfamily)
MPASGPQEKPQVSAYRNLAREALESVGEYNARAHWYEAKGEAQIALEYRQLSQEALARAQRYKALAALSEKQRSPSAHALG